MSVVEYAPSSRPTIHDVALDWLAQGRRVATAVLIQKIGVGPIQPGAEIIVDDRGRVEGHFPPTLQQPVAEEVRVVNAGTQPETVMYAIEDGSRLDRERRECGCGGIAEIFIQRIGTEHRSAFEAIRHSRTNDRAAALVTVLSGRFSGSKLGVSGRAGVVTEGVPPGLADELVACAREALQGDADTLIWSDDKIRVLIQMFRPTPRLVVAAQTATSRSVAQIARQLGYRVALVDMSDDGEPGSYRATAAITEFADNVFPASRTLGPFDAILIDGADDLHRQLLIPALRSNVGYIGLIGGGKSLHEARRVVASEGVKSPHMDRIDFLSGAQFTGSPTDRAITIIARVIEQREARRSTTSLGRLNNET